MSDNDYGRLGVIRFMKRQDPEAIVASYPIDDEEVTFGRDQSCNVRLYYPAVSPVHAKLIFRERKAFLVVLGTHGVHIDDCPVHPAPPTATAPTTVPLLNNTHIEINKKRFRFEYPPKALRAALLATPSPQKSSSRRALRMSMIQSAQVFSPAPSTDPRENLRVLQSPIKPLASPLKKGYRAPSPDDDEDEDDAGAEDEEEIVLVDGDCPRVVQEEKDLIILEDVQVFVPPPSPSHSTPTPVGESTQPLNIQKRNGPPGMRAPARTGGWVGRLQSTPQRSPPKPQVQQYQTPKRPPRPSLHRAVLIRSAQRAVMRVEMEQEEVEEEKEVEMSVVAVEETIEEDEEGELEKREDEDEDAQGSSDEDDEGEQQEQPRTFSGWRKSLEAVRNGWERIRSRSRSPEKGEQAMKQDQEEEDITEAQGHQEDHDSAEVAGHDSTDEDDSEANDHFEYDKHSSADAAVHPDVPHFTPQRAQQPARVARPAPLFMTPQPSRLSTGKADRVRGLGRLSHGGFGARDSGMPWKVRDIVVPVKGHEDEVKREADEEEWIGETRRVSAEEKKAIQERRRSAYMAPDPFFGDQIPGTRRSDSLAPSAPATPSAPRSPVKDRLREEEDEKEETSVLLERMREMVEGLQRRRSGKMDGDAKEALRKQLVQEHEDTQGVAGEVEEEEVADIDGQGEEHGEEHVEMDVDEAEEAPHPSTSTAPHAYQLPPQTPHTAEMKHVATSTPRLDGVRELFRATEQGIARTPKLDGVREMYLRERARDLPPPDYEGIENMMVTPAAYRAPPPDQGQEVEDGGAEDEDKDQETVSGRSTPDELAPVLTRSTRGRKTPAPAVETVARKRMPTDGSTMGDDEATPDVGVARPKAGKKAVIASDKPKGAIVRRTRKATEEAEEPPAPVKSATRGRKAVSTNVTKAPPKAATSTAASRVTRISRKAVDSALSTDDEPIAKQPARRTRGTKAAAGPSEESTATVRAPAMRRGVKAKDPAPISDDEMDSIDQPEDAPAPAPARRAGKAKAAAEEDSTDTALRNTRGRKTPTTTAAATTRSTTTAKGRAASSTRKAAGSEVKVKKEKENTPEVSGREEEEKVLPAAKAVRTKRATATAKGKAQSEPEREVAEVGKTRAARTRAASARK